eukprot:6214495-Pleurochrysis_carterae.AAC.3
MLSLVFHSSLFLSLSLTHTRTHRRTQARTTTHARARSGSGAIPFARSLSLLLPLPSFSPLRLPAPYLPPLAFPPHSLSPSPPLLFALAFAFVLSRSDLITLMHSGKSTHLKVEWRFFARSLRQDSPLHTCEEACQSMPGEANLQGGAMRPCEKVDEKEA